MANVRARLVQHRGIAYVLLAGFFFTIGAAVSKALKHIPSGEYSAISTYHPFFMTITMCYFVGYTPYNFCKKKRVFIYCSLRAVAFIIKIFSISKMPLGDASAIYFTSPIFAGIGARIFLGEPWGIVHLISTLLGLTGVVLISKPSFLFNTDTASEVNPLYPALAVTGAVILGAGITVQRKIGKDVPASVIAVHQNALTIIYSLAFEYIVNAATGKDLSKVLVAPACYDERLLLFVVGVLAVAGQVLFIRGVALESAAISSLMRNMDTVLAYIIQVTYFKEKAEWLSLLGAFLIITSTVIVILYKSYMMKKSEKEAGKEDVVLENVASINEQDANLGDNIGDNGATKKEHYQADNGNYNGTVAVKNGVAKD